LAYSRAWVFVLTAGAHHLYVSILIWKHKISIGIGEWIVACFPLLPQFKTLCSDRHIMFHILVEKLYQDWLTKIPILTIHVTELPWWLWTMLMLAIETIEIGCWLLAMSVISCWLLVELIGESRGTVLSLTIFAPIRNYPYPLPVVGYIWMNMKRCFKWDSSL
jgi:hypothetical protein